MKRCALGLACLFTVTAFADEAPKALAISTLETIERLNDLLPGAIRSGDSGDFSRFIEHPVIEKFNEWPSLENEQYNGYRRCQFALDAFRIYAGDQFKALGRLPDSATVTKDFLDQKRRCARAIKMDGARSAE